MLTLPVQSVAWKDRPWNDLLCVERDVSNCSLSHSLPTTDAKRCKIGLDHLWWGHPEGRFQL